MIGRRVVLGQVDGADRIVSDAAVDAIPLAANGVSAHMLWGRDAPARLPDDGAPPAYGPGFPPADGLRFAALTIPAGSSEDYHGFVVAALGDHAITGTPGMHWTPTVDCIVIHRGELVLEDDAGETVVRAGDSVVINANRHRWTNRGSEDAILFAFQVGIAAA